MAGFKLLAFGILPDYFKLMKLSPEDKKRIIDYYRQHLAKHGMYSAQALSWIDENSQIIRFQALVEVGDLSGQSILDVGSGLGDLYAFLGQRFKNFRYQGIDLVPDLVQKAREKYPGVDFKNIDIMDFKGKYDYVLSSGAFSFKVQNHKEFYFEMIKKLFSLAKKGVAFNMLNRKGHVDDDLFAAYDLNEVRDFCQKLTPKVKINHQYSIQDFTVFLYP